MNYFDHEENVKFVDGILEYSQEWQWLFDYIDKRYVFEEPKSHELHNSYSIREVYQHSVQSKVVSCDI